MKSDMTAQTEVSLQNIGCLANLGPQSGLGQILKYKFGFVLFRLS